MGFFPGNLPPSLWPRIPVNALAFLFRNRLRWSRGKPALRGETQEDDFALWPQPQRQEARRQAQDLAARHGLGQYASILNRYQYRENLARLGWLGRILDSRLPSDPRTSQPLRVLDVGTADWHYVFALHAYFTSKGKLLLTGLEVDGFGIYPNGHSRADYARAYVAALRDPGISLRFEDALHADLPPQDVVLCFFPFLLPYQILSWGLPLKNLRPAALLARQAAWVTPGGYWLICTHAEEERQPLMQLLQAFPEIDILDQGPLPGVFAAPGRENGERRFWLMRRRSVS